MQAVRSLIRIKHKICFSKKFKNFRILTGLDSVDAENLDTFAT